LVLDESVLLLEESGSVVVIEILEELEDSDVLEVERLVKTLKQILEKNLI